MNRFRIVITAVGLAALVGGGIVSISGPGDPDGEPRPYDPASVYSAILEYTAHLGKVLPYSPADNRWRGNIRFLVHSQSYLPPLERFTLQSYYQDLSHLLPTLGSSTWRDFRRQNAVLAPIPRVLSSAIPLAFVTFGSREVLVSDTPLGRLYPNAVGVFIFSRPGFGASGRQALVHVAPRLDSDAPGSFALLRLLPGGWAVVRYQHAP